MHCRFSQNFYLFGLKTYDMSAHKLAAAVSLRTYFQQLDTLAIQQALGRNIYQKGLNYYETDAVEELDVRDANTIDAEVFGSEEYEVKIFAQSGSVQAQCSCPFDREWGGMCKHIAAVLIKAVEEELWEEVPEVEETAAAVLAEEKPSAGKDDIFETWLGSLSADELRQTVRKLASPDFEEGIRIRYGNKGQRDQVFLDTKKKIQRLFDHLGYYDGGEYFNEEITPLMEKLRGVWAEHAEEVKDLFLQIIGEIDEAQEEGSLFDENSEESYNGSELMGFLTDFLNDLPDEVRVAYLPVFWEAVYEESFDSFAVFLIMAPENLKPTDWGSLKKYLLDSEVLSQAEFARAAHEIFEPLMTPEEKGEWLKNLAGRSDKFAVPLALFYEKEEGNVKKAAKTLDQIIEKLLASKGVFFGGGEVEKQILEERIRLAQVLKEPLETLCEKYVELLPQAETLRRTLSLVPEQKSQLEPVLKQRNINEFLVHLESEKRLGEVVSIIESKKNEFAFGSSFGFSLGFSRYDFYVRHKKELPEKALACFRERLDEELPHTGDRHYQAVVDALRNMKTLLPEAQCQQQISNIRAHYNRRRNLMAMLDGAFGKR